MATGMDATWAMRTICGRQMSLGIPRVPYRIRSIRPPTRRGADETLTTWAVTTAASPGHKMLDGADEPR